jgi:hypothetical protein
VSALPSISAKFSSVACDISLKSGNIPVHLTFIADELCESANYKEVSE